MKHFLHADIDAFFASVEQISHPELRGKPVIIGGTNNRGVVSTASYEARKFGVHSAMPIAKAKQLCPEGIFLPVRMREYERISNEIMELLFSASPDVIQISIDEACIDVTGTEKLFGSFEKLGFMLKEKIKAKTGLTISIGAARNQYIAKLASEIKKPDGFFLVPDGEEANFVKTLPLEKLWGIGPATLSKIKSCGIFTTAELAEKNISWLTTMFGPSLGNFLFNASHGNEIEIFSKKVFEHSISSEKTFSRDSADRFALETALLELCHTIVFRMRREKKTSKTICIKIRYADFETVSMQKKFPSEITSIEDLFEKVKMLFEKKCEAHRAVRLLGISVENVSDETQSAQAELFETSKSKQSKVEKAIIELQEKHPKAKIHKARENDEENKVQLLE